MLVSEVDSRVIGRASLVIESGLFGGDIGGQVLLFWNKKAGPVHHIGCYTSSVG